MRRSRHSFGFGGGQPSPFSAVPGRDIEAEGAKYVLCVTSPDGTHRDFSFWTDTYKMKIFAKQRANEGGTVTVWKNAGMIEMDR